MGNPIIIKAISETSIYSPEEVQDVYNEVCSYVKTLVILEMAALFNWKPSNLVLKLSQELRTRQ